MNIDQAIIKVLASDAAVVTSLGPLTNGVPSRIYPLVVPEATKGVAAAYMVVDNERVGSMEGPSGMASPVYSFTVWGDTKAEARGAGETIRRALDGFSGTVVIDAESLAIHGIILLGGGGDGYDDDRRRYSVELLFRVMHAED